MLIYDIYIHTCTRLIYGAGPEWMSSSVIVWPDLISPQHLVMSVCPSLVHCPETIRWQDSIYLGRGDGEKDETILNCNWSGRALFAELDEIPLNGIMECSTYTDSKSPFSELNNTTTISQDLFFHNTLVLGFNNHLWDGNWKLSMLYGRLQVLSDLRIWLKPRTFIIRINPQQKDSK